MSRISSVPRPSGRSFRTAMRSRTVFFSSLANALLRPRAGARRSPRTPGRRRSARAPRPRRPSWRPGGRACPGPTSPRRPSGRTPRRSRRTGPRRSRGPRSGTSACRPASRSSCWAAQSFLISPCAMSSASRISASGTSLAPASTMRMASSVPATTRSRSLRPSARSASAGLTTKLPSTLPMRTAPTGVGSGTGEIISAAEAPFIARMSYGWTWSTLSGMPTSCVS